MSKPEQPSSTSFFKRPKVIIALIIAVYGALFLALNNDDVEVHFVFFTTRIALFWALALAVGVGVAIGLLIRLRRKPHAEKRHD